MFKFCVDNLTSFVSAATGSLQKGISIDPCTPKGFSLDLESHTLSPHSLSGKNKYTFHAKGNFSECRSAALRLLHKEKGCKYYLFSLNSISVVIFKRKKYNYSFLRDTDKCTYPHCHIGSTFIPKLHGKFLATENFFYTAKVFKILVMLRFMLLYDSSNLLFLSVALPFLFFLPFEI